MGQRCYWRPYVALILAVAYSCVAEEATANAFPRPYVITDPGGSSHVIIFQNQGERSARRTQISLDQANARIADATTVDYLAAREAQYRKTAADLNDLKQNELRTSIDKGWDQAQKAQIAAAAHATRAAA